MDRREFIAAAGTAAALTSASRAFAQAGEWALAASGLPEDGMWKSAPVFADVNGDGFMDLVVASRMEGGITVYFGDGSGKFWKEASSDGLPKSGWADRILLQDIDGGGHLDIVASYSEGPRVWRGDGRGHWQP